MIQFTVSTNAVPQIKGFLRDFNKAVNDQIEADAIVTVSQARKIHRHTTRTGNLNRATQYKMFRRDNGVKFFIDDVKAEYGKYIHDGTKFWRKDPYLANAVKRNQKTMQKDIRVAIDKVIRKNHLDK